MGIPRQHPHRFHRPRLRDCPAASSTAVALRLWRSAAAQQPSHGLSHGGGPTASRRVINCNASAAALRLFASLQRPPHYRSAASSTRTTPPSTAPGLAEGGSPTSLPWLRPMATSTTEVAPAANPSLDHGGDLHYHPAALSLRTPLRPKGGLTYGGGPAAFSRTRLWRWFTLLIRGPVHGGPMVIPQACQNDGPAFRGHPAAVPAASADEAAASPLSFRGPSTAAAAPWPGSSLPPRVPLPAWSPHQLRARLPLPSHTPPPSHSRNLSPRRGVEE